MAFGDGENDAEMLSFAGTGVAVAASDPAARAAADVVCGDVDEDGIARALERVRPAVAPRAAAARP